MQLSVFLLTFISIWPGASATFLYQELAVLLACVAIGFGMGRSWRAVRATLFVLLLAGLVLARAALTNYSGGRAATTTMYDTNDLAYLLVTVLPLAIGFAVCATSMVRRIAYVAAATTLTIAILLTQSRGGLLALITVALLLIFSPPSPEEGRHRCPKIDRGKKGMALGRILCCRCSSLVAPA